ncbi:MAG TPA: Crp/Fnr family transcriptional regulator [Emticicia sp.]
MFDQLKNNFDLNNGKWGQYASYFKQQKVPAKTVLLHEGEVAKKMFFVEKGCLRVWFNNNGKDLTSQFFFENSTVSSIESFRKEIPSPVTIEAIEPSTIWWIHKTDLDKILEEIKQVPELRDRFIDALFERTFEYMKYAFSFIKDTPLQRYENLLKERPQLIQRIPQHYIASYLGITSVHLSRIKSQLAKKKS